MTRLLVAGAGLIGARHVAHIEAHPEVTLAGIIDPRPDAGEGHSVPVFAAFDQVDVSADGVVIATPTDLHPDHAELAARRGWPMLIEKPVAGDLAGADRVIASSRKAGVSVLVGHHRRHHPRVTRLKALLSEGAIGLPVVASLIWAVRKPDSYFADNWRTGAGGSPVLINLVHDIDILRHLFGEVGTISALPAPALRGSGRVEGGAVTLQFQNGPVVTISFADTTPSPWGFEAGTGENPNIATTGQDMLWIVGSEGAVSFPSLTLWQGAADWSEAPAPRQEHVPDAAPLDHQLSHFAAVIRGEAVPLIDAEEARRSLAATLEVEAQLRRLRKAA